MGWTCRPGTLASNKYEAIKFVFVHRGDRVGIRALENSWFTSDYSDHDELAAQGDSSESYFHELDQGDAGFEWYIDGPSSKSLVSSGDKIRIRNARFVDNPLTHEDDGFLTVGAALVTWNDSWIIAKERA